jgi:PAT family beta-lactamase induction signal transducer AmpG
VGKMDIIFCYSMINHFFCTLRMQDLGDALGYSFKFLWAPIVDLFPLPVLGRLLGRRRSWMLLSQLAVIGAICLMAFVDPASGTSYLTVMACAAVLLGFSSATQDIVIDAYRIECAEQSLQALLAAMYIAGYRCGMLVAGAGSLFLASGLGSVAGSYSYSAWKITYLTMAGVMCCGVLTTLMINEPQREGIAAVSYNYSSSDYGQFVAIFVLSMAAFGSIFFYLAPLAAMVKEVFGSSVILGGGLGGFMIEVLRFCSAFSAAALVASIAAKLGLVNKTMVRQSYIEPVREFFLRFGGRSALLLLLLVGFYRLSDIVLGVVSNVFYLDMGFSKNVIAGITKSFGLAMVLTGGFLGGILTIRFGVNRILFLGAFLSAATNLLFMLLAKSGTDITMLTLVIAADNLSAGIATTAFIAFLSSLTSISFTAVQYAIFSSLMTLFPKLIGGYSGTMVENMGYENFFLLTAVMGLPVLALVLVVRKIT